jgi:hypothetical protein
MKANLKRKNYYLHENKIRRVTESCHPRMLLSGVQSWFDSTHHDPETDRRVTIR